MNSFKAYHDQSDQEREHMARIEHLIEDIELKVFMLFYESCDVTEITCSWAAMTSTVSQSARNRITELGGDVDAVMKSIDDFFLFEHPELL